MASWSSTDAAGSNMRLPCEEEEERAEAVGVHEGVPTKGGTADEQGRNNVDATAWEPNDVRRNTNAAEHPAWDEYS